MRQTPITLGDNDTIKRTVDELWQDIDGLERQVGAAKMAGGETYVRVKDPAALLRTMTDAANMLDDLRGWYGEGGK